MPVHCDCTNFFHCGSSDWVTVHSDCKKISHCGSSDWVTVHCDCTKYSHCGKSDWLTVQNFLTVAGLTGWLYTVTIQNFLTVAGLTGWLYTVTIQNFLTVAGLTGWLYNLTILYLTLWLGHSTKIYTDCSNCSSMTVTTEQHVQAHCAPQNNLFTENFTVGQKCCCSMNKLYIYVLHVTCCMKRKKLVTPRSKAEQKIYTMVLCVACYVLHDMKKACYPSFESWTKNLYNRACYMLQHINLVGKTVSKPFVSAILFCCT